VISRSSWNTVGVIALCLLGILAFCWVATLVHRAEVNQMLAEREAPWESAHTLKVEDVVAEGRLRIVSFFDNDSVLILQHLPSGFFTSTRTLREIRIRYINDSPALTFRYYMIEPDGVTVNKFEKFNDLLIDRRDLAKALAVLRVSPPRLSPYSSP
jgi:hypothetical protein